MVGQLSKILGAVRQTWVYGGSWERFFVLAPVLWVAYALSLLVILVKDPRLATDPRLTFQFYMVMLLILTYGILLDAWRFPLILSSRILRTVAQHPDSREDFLNNVSAWTNAIRYLESNNRSGRWREGNFLSLMYFLTYLAWGAVALKLPEISGISDGLSNLVLFVLLHSATLIIMIWAYRRALHRLALDADRQGLPFMTVTV